MSTSWSAEDAPDADETTKVKAGPKKDGQSAASVLWSIVGDRIPWGVSCLLILAIVGYIFLSEAGLVRSSGLAETKAVLEAENLRLEEENRQLAVRLERIRNDPGYLEDEARKKLGLVRPDETIYRLAEEPDLSDEELRGRLE
ncbi:MAG: septum formation initiator family protein [Deltaproteobacteria bacterium]|jgi:cell division protein FtsB|nr:septum formation initiator family protein [Deltaproteobacteria bacterium]